MTQNTLRPTALVIGATGGIGGEMTLALLRRGWRIRALNRNATKAAKDHASLGPVEWVAGDAMKPADVIAAADSVSLIVHAANPPGYRDWERLALPMLDSSIAAAEACDARIVFPGTVYNYGPDAFPLLTETSPQAPLTRKGRVRFAMEQRLRDAAGRGVRTLIVRTGDFFGPRAGNNWFAGGMIKPGKPVRSVYNPGSPGVGHAWAYLPDVAQTMAQLIDREPDLAAFETFHFGGHWMEDGVELAEAIVRATGNPGIPIRRFPWWAMRLAAPFFTLAWELQEMRYLWKEPVRLDNRKLTAFLGGEPHTPLDTAVSVTLEGLCCVPGDRTAKALPVAA